MSMLVAKFERVSKEQYGIDTGLTGFDLDMDYSQLKMPQRATRGSCGYDFFTNRDIVLLTGETTIVKTGLRCKIQEDWFLMICPRSGLGFKYRIQLDNTVGIIDSDYYNAKNEGHILIKITNDGFSGKTCYINKGEAFAQGIFIPYGITINDDTTRTREGGFGSTTGVVG